jgi:hypothetical protein
MSPRELISGQSHSFDTGIAKILGLNAAVVFNHILYWLKINSSKEKNMRDGKVWMYETQKEMADFLEYMTLEEVKKSIVKLLDAGLLIKANYNSNPFDKTSWYTTSDQSIFLIKKTLTKAPYGAIDNAVGRDPLRPTAPCYIQENKQEEKQQLSVVGAVAPPSEVPKEASSSSEEKNQEKDDSVPHKAFVLQRDGSKLEVTESQLYERVVRSRCDFSADAIRYAWQSLCDYKFVVHDWWRFIEGTAKNYVDKKKSKQMGSAKCQQQNKQHTKTTQRQDSSKDSRKASLEPDSSGQHLPALVSMSSQLPKSRNLLWNLKSF